MGMFYGSLQHSYSGKRRKTNAWKKKKRHQLRSQRNDVSTELRVPQHVLDRQAEAKAHREKYPSYQPSTSTYVPTKDDSWKLEESKNWTVAPAYNKGAYQVIPKSNIKDIGK